MSHCNKKYDVKLKIYGETSFYSHRNQLGDNHDFSNLLELKNNFDCNQQIDISSKTGLGSSAAMCSSMAASFYLLMNG